MAMMRKSEKVIDDGQNAASKHFIDGVDVGSDAGDEAANRVIVEEADMHALHVAEDVAAQIEHDFLAGPLHQVGLDEFKKISGEQRRQVEHGEAGNSLVGAVGEIFEKEPGGTAFVRQDDSGRAVACLGGEIAINSHHHQVGSSYITERFEGNGDGRDDCLPPIGFQIMGETPNEPGVVDLANGILIGLASRLRLASAWLFRIGLAWFLGVVRHCRGCFLLYCTGSTPQGAGSAEGRNGEWLVSGRNIIPRGQRFNLPGFSIEFASEAV